MKKWLIRILIAVAVIAATTASFTYYQMRSMGLFRSPVYDRQPPLIPALGHPAILIFYKTNGFIHAEAIPAANALLQQLGKKLGCSVYLTENGAINNKVDLDRFDVVIWNNVTGDVLTPEQQQSFQQWIEGGGHWLGIHGTGGDWFKWTWFVDHVIGAKFVGHTLHPQIATAKLSFEDREHPLLAGIPATMEWKDELYSFALSPRQSVHVLANLDESSYLEGQLFSSKLQMGDHPIIWWQRVGNGIAIYSALGHTAEAYSNPEYQRFLENSLRWLMAPDQQVKK